jgi:hypothetical protein
MKNFERLVFVDLGELSKSKFGDSIQEAHVIKTGSSLKLQIDTGVISREFPLSRRKSPGTYIAYDANGDLIGVSNHEYLVDG